MTSARLGTCLAAAIGLLLMGVANAQEDANGAVQVPSMSLPESSFLSEASRAALKAGRVREQAYATDAGPCAPIETADAVHAPQIRRCEIEQFLKSAVYEQMRTRYHVTVTPTRLGGVPTEVFEPTSGIASRNRRRVLINVHGGGFMDGSRMSSQLESLPIAALGQIKVVSVDYRLAPEYEFPAGSVDAAAVYRELLKTYKAQNIGIYGCSAGGLLAAETIAWLVKERMPLPGAVGMFCNGAAYWTEGDAGLIGQKMAGDDIVWATADRNPYFTHTRLDDALAFPIRSRALMAKFPPSLLIAATRDPALSSVVRTHSVLTAVGVPAELHVWEGLGHAFFMDPTLDESREVYSVVTRFFDKYLGEN